MSKIYKKKYSAFGLFLVVSYVVLSALSIGLALMLEGDNKGKFIFLQIPIVFQHMALMELGLIKYLENISWPEAYLYLGLPMIIFLYFVGWFFEKMKKRHNSQNEH